MKKLLVVIGCFISLSLMAGNPVLEAHVCQADKFLAGCDVFQRADGNQVGVPVDIGGTTYDLYLSWGTPTEFAYEDSMVVGGKYIFNCQTLTAPGEYRDTLAKADGCDSIVILTLTEYIPVPPCKDTTVAYTDSVAVGGKYIFNCQTLTAPGEYRDTLVKADGCDSIVVLTLTEYTPYVPPVVVHDTVSVDVPLPDVCPGEVVKSRLRELTINRDTTWADTVKNIIMSDLLIRDSIYNYSISILLPTTGDTTAYVCEGEMFFWHGKLGYEGSKWTTTNAAGCDSVVTLHIETLQPTTGDTTAYVCEGESFKWHGKWVLDGAQWTTTNVAGCDSVVTLHLIPQPTSVDTLPAFAKDNNWLLMFGRKQVRDAYQLEPAEEQVLWYKVGRGSDKFLGTGYYYTEGQALVGDYYAKIIGIDLSPLGACVREARTITLHCGPANLTPRLAPTIVGAGQPMELSNLDANEESQIVIYNVAGSVIRQFRVQGNETFHLTAEETCGLYLLHVENGHQSTTLKYIVNQ